MARTRWVVLDSYGHIVFKTDSLKDCKRWLGVLANPRSDAPRAFALGGSAYEVQSNEGTFTIMPERQHRVTGGR